MMLFDDHGFLGNRQATEHYAKLIPSNFHFINHTTEIGFKFYTRHEKAVVVDDRIGFITGSDLASGRFELFPSFPLFDLAGTFPGLDYYNTYSKKCQKKQLLDRKYENRTPWQDIGIRFTGRDRHQIRLFVFGLNIVLQT